MKQNADFSQSSYNKMLMQIDSALNEMEDFIPGAFVRRNQL